MHPGQEATPVAFTHNQHKRRRDRAILRLRDTSMAPNWGGYDGGGTSDKTIPSPIRFEGKPPAPLPWGGWYVLYQPPNFPSQHDRYS